MIRADKALLSSESVPNGGTTVLPKKTTVYTVVFLTEITSQTKRYAGSSDKGFILEAAVFHFASVL